VIDAENHLIASAKKKFISILHQWFENILIRFENLGANNEKNTSLDKH